MKKNNNETKEKIKKHYVCNQYAQVAFKYRGN